MTIKKGAAVVLFLSFFFVLFFLQFVTVDLNIKTQALFPKSDYQYKSSLVTLDELGHIGGVGGGWGKDDFVHQTQLVSNLFFCLFFFSLFLFS